MTLLIVLGILGILLNRRNYILLLVCLELMLLGISCGFVWFSLVTDSALGILFTLFVLTVAAAESAIGLAIFVSYYRLRGSIAIKSSNLLRG